MSFFGGGSSKSQTILAVLAEQREREAERVRQIRADVQTRKEKVSQVRQGRIKKGQILQRAKNAGTGGGTSGLVGAISSVASTVAENIGTLGQFRGFAERISTLTQEAANFRGLAAREERKRKEKAAKISSIISIGTSIVGAVAAPFTGGLSLGAAAGAGAAGFSGTAFASQALSGLGASDRRLKEDVEQIGMHKIGVPLYTWTFLWGERGIGVMADELKEVMPDAVQTIDGFDYVDYDMIGGKT
jgi:hypothetical protein